MSRQHLSVAQIGGWICLRALHYVSPLWYGSALEIVPCVFFHQSTFLIFTLDDMDRITIETGMQDITEGTCIKFIPRTHEGSFLDIQPRYG